MLKNRITLGIAILALSGAIALLLTSCGAPEAMLSSEESYDSYEEGAAAPAADQAARPAEYGTVVTKQVDGEVGETSLRLVVRNGSLYLIVINTRETINAVRELVKETEGIISYSYVYEIRKDVYGANLTIRVPQTSFDPVMAQLEALGKASNVETWQDDVTMQYVDLESRLNNQKAQEERLVEILALAKTVEEVLEVERELARVRGEIESMTAQHRHLSDQIAYSTINLNLEEEIVPTQTVAPDAFENIGERLSQGFISGLNVVLRGISALLVALVTLLPLFVILAVVICLVWLIARKIRQKKKPSN